jgi:hypothetical protein
MINLAVAFKYEEKNRLHLFTIHILRKIIMAARSKAWTVSAPSNAGIVGSNPARGMDVCVRIFCACVVLCVGSSLATGWSPV